ncbi:DUF1516 family protein [Fervidibacillus halotolerans]|uniref:DUF1516 family protein n=1 Tax=Fervidibacillus halotolerans TaxID=2980027 RepID=A0A9E8M0Q6_9BACI|nr:DUF1516 family protein [Fervidibacillus halotolerans]WAA13041.1 DUF1516 family protein [Fervidibacillus halotolerans]
MTHLHITTWVLTLLLFFTLFIVQKGENKRLVKGLQIALRVMYLFIIATGLHLFFQVDANFQYDIKMLAGILTIAAMELLFNSYKKGKLTKVFGFIFAAILIYTIYLGFRLPLGIFFY